MDKVIQGRGLLGVRPYRLTLLARWWILKTPSGDIGIKAGWALVSNELDALSKKF